MGECVGLIFWPLGDMMLVSVPPQDPACMSSTERSLLMLLDSSWLRLSCFMKGGLGLQATAPSEAGREAGVERRSSPNPLTVAGVWNDHAVLPLSSPGPFHRVQLCLNTEDPGWCNISSRN